MSDQVLEHIFKEDCRISIADICKAHMEKALVWIPRLPWFN